MPASSPSYVTRRGTRNRMWNSSGTFSRRPNGGSGSRSYANVGHAMFRPLATACGGFMSTRSTSVNSGNKVSWGLAALFLANPAAVVAELRGIAEDSVHRTISRQDLVEQLRRRGLPLRHLLNSEHAVPAVQAATDRFLDSARLKLIQRRLVSKAAAKTLLSRLDRNSE